MQVCHVGHCECWYQCLHHNINWILHSTIILSCVWLMVWTEIVTCTSLTFPHIANTVIDRVKCDVAWTVIAVFLLRNASMKHGLSRHMVSVSVWVCLSVTFVHSVKTNKDIFKIFSPSGSQAILVFLYQTAWQYSDRNTPNGGIECRWGRLLGAYIWLHCALLTLRLARCCQYDPAGPLSRKLWHLSLVASGGVDSRRQRRNVYDKKPQCYAKDNRTVHLIARSDKSVAYVTNNKRLLDVLYCWS